MLDLKGLGRAWCGGDPCLNRCEKRGALAAIGKREAAQGHTVLIERGRRAANRAKRGHGWLQKVRLGLQIKRRPFEAQGKPALQKEKPRQRRGGVLNDRIIWDELYNCQMKNWAKREEQPISGEKRGDRLFGGEEVKARSL